MISSVYLRYVAIGAKFVLFSKIKFGSFLHYHKYNETISIFQVWHYI